MRCSSMLSFGVERAERREVRKVEREVVGVVVGVVEEGVVEEGVVGVGVVGFGLGR